MGAFLNKPKTEKNTDIGEGNGIKYGLCSMQGWRIDMEDAHTTVVSLDDMLKAWSFFAVFDGHAGKIAADICSRDLVDKIQSVLTNDVMAGLTDAGSYSTDKVEETIKKSFLAMDTILRDQLRHQGDRSGTTCTSILVTPKHYFFINCGDSRGMLVKDGKVSFSTVDHKPTNDAERDRIVRAGGMVMTQRINGSLAVSRALGDFDYKQDEGREQTEQLVSPEPDIVCIERDEENDQFICLACDGIFDVFSNEDLADYIISRLEISKQYDMITAEIVDTSLHKESRDNMSVILLALPGCIQENDAAKEKEKKLDELLDSNVKTIIEEYKKNEQEFSINMKDISFKLSEIEEITNLLPKGGGIKSKHSFVEPLLGKYCPKLRDDGHMDE